MVETIVHEYFLNLSQLNPVAASRTAGKDIQSPVLSALLVKFCSAEEIYNSLEFLKRKRFRRDNFLLSLYATIQEELKREIYLEHSSIVRSLDITSSDNTKPFPLYVYEALLELVIIRKLLLKGYTRISYQSSSVPFEAWLSIIDEAWGRHQAYTFPRSIEPLSNSIRLELLILRHMIFAQKDLNDFNMLGSTINLYTAHSNYTHWRNLCYYAGRIQSEQEAISEPSNVLSLFTTIAEQFNFKSNKTPLQVSSLMRWIEKLYDHLASKMTLYFHRSLLDREKISGGDERSLWRRCEIDFYAMVRNFRKRSGAHSVSLLYEVDTTILFSNMGFVCSKTPYQSPTGLESFPFIFSYPEDHPIEHWPNIVSMIMADNQTQRLQPQDVTSPSSFASANTSENVPLSSTSTMSLSGSHALSNALSVAGLTSMKPNISPPPNSSSLSSQPPVTQGASSAPKVNQSNTLTIPVLQPTDTSLPVPTQFYDKKVGATYYLSRVDPRVTLSVVFLDRHSSRDTVGSEFVAELTARLRFTHVTQMLSRADL